MERWPFFKLINKLQVSFWIILKLYYDSSKGALNLGNSILSCLFTIDCGVKQGGILSPFLFNIYINDLIEECTNANLGAVFGIINVSIIVYADDILLISPVDSHLQKLLNICSNYGQFWRIKFNPLKSSIIEFGTQFFQNSQFFINSLPLQKTNNLKYLGIDIDFTLNFDLIACEKFKNVQKSIFSLSYLGLTPQGVSPTLKSLIYKTYCLSQFTYALETTTLTKKTRDYLNVSQNNLLRQMIGLNKFCHMSKILLALKIHNFEQLYIKSKLSFLNSIKSNELSSMILKSLIEKKNTCKPSSKSFTKDLILLEKHFNLDISVIYDSKMLDKLNLDLKKLFLQKNGLLDSIKICLNFYKIKLYKTMLDNLTKPEFLKDDEEFQELLQYLIITS